MMWWSKKKKRTLPTLGDDATQKTRVEQHTSLNVPAWFQRWRSNKGSALTPPSSDVTSPSKSVQALSTFKVDKDQVAFGLRWQALPKGERQKLQSASLKEGYTHVVQDAEASVLGFAKLSDLQVDKGGGVFSAALLLSETVSLGGNELFVFRVDEARFALIALNNTLPVPGFDLIGSEQTIARATENYLSLPHKSEVRRCGDANVLSGAEAFEFTSATVAITDNIGRLTLIPNLEKLIRRGVWIGIASLMLTVAYFSWSYYEEKEQAERLQRESDPNLLYEQSYLSAASAVYLLGTEGVEPMQTTLEKIPLEIAGWSLTAVACQPLECVATWTRQYGSFADFDANLPADVKQAPEYGFVAADTKNLQLKTKHPILVSQKGLSLKRENLPTVGQVQAELVSLFQDYTLIDARVSVTAPAPFPNSTIDIGAIFKPVLVGTWSIELPLWSLSSMTLPDYAKAENLSLTIPKLDGATSKNDMSANTFKLTGKYYAKGKIF